MSERNPGDYNVYFSENDEDAYLMSDSFSKIRLMIDPEEPDPEKIPVYVDLENGEAYHPEGVSSDFAEEAARNAISRSSKTTMFGVTQDNTRWEEEFSELLDFEIDLGRNESLNLGSEPEHGPRRYI